MYWETYGERTQAPGETHEKTGKSLSLLYISSFIL